MLPQLESDVKTVIVGAGPTGLYTAISLASRGREVVVVDRDPGPPAEGYWRRRGVMQFEHAHSFRGQVVDALEAEMPEVLNALLAAGATIVTVPEHPGRPAALRCRRSVFERELRRRAAREPRVRIITGHVDRVVSDRRRAIGVRVGESVIEADCVIDASGRASRLARTLPRPEERTDCGATYIGRQYRLRAGASLGPTNSVIGLSLSLADYGAVVFAHDSGTFTVTLIHSGGDERMHRLRHDAVFTAVMRTIPGVADWLDQAMPIASALPGGRLYNRYAGQLDDSGRPVLDGLISVGDAVCTTTPLAGRGIALAFVQARQLVQLMTDGDTDLATVTTEFDAWCTANIEPWFLDHRYVDAERVRRWSGHDVDLDRPLPSDLVVAAAAADPRLRAVVEPYVTMDALPSSLAPAHGRAQEIYAAGWRPTPQPGPTLDELIEVASRTPEAA
jgi:2-polyprenyl-6-methoxyphenol hydroxylase-like FAD-dependent oxidoreductase